MFLVKCIPFVGTAINAGEAIGALCNGDGKGFVCKLAETAVGAGMDTVFVLSGGASSILTAPLKGGTLEVGKAVTKKGLEKLIIRESGQLLTNVAVRAGANVVFNGGQSNSYRSSWSSSSGNGYHSQSTSNTSTSTGNSSGSGNSTGSGNSSNTANSSNAANNGGDPPRDFNTNLPNQHQADYDNVIGASDNVVTHIELGPNGRVESLQALIRQHHLRPRGSSRQNITARVRRFVDALGRVVGVPGVRDSDEVGHMIGDGLGGPSNMTYNFFPQSPHCNMDYYHNVESRIYNYLEQNGSDGFARISIEFVYVDYITGLSPHRPRAIKVRVEFSNGTSFCYEYSNA